MWPERDARCGLRWGGGEAARGAPPFLPNLAAHLRSTGVLESPLQPGPGGGSVRASGRVGAPPLPLFPSDPPLASDFFLCGSSRACQKNALDGARERAGRAVRVCARSCAPVLPLTSLKRAVPELQRRGSLQFFFCGPAPAGSRRRPARSLLPRQPRAGHPSPHRRCPPGGLGPPPAAPESRQMGGRAPAGC